MLLLIPLVLPEANFDAEVSLQIVIRGWPGDQTLCTGTGGNRRTPVVCNIGPPLFPRRSSGEAGSRHIGPKRPVLHSPASISL